MGFELNFLFFVGEEAGTEEIDVRLDSMFIFYDIIVEC